jgi:WD40 repeat protein
MVRIWDLDVSDGTSDDLDDVARAAAAAASTILLKRWSPEELDSVSLQTQITDRIVAAQAAIDARSGRALLGHLPKRTFSHDGHSFLYLPDGNTVAVLDLATLTERFRLSGHTDLIMWAGTSPNDKVVATSSWDKTVRIWSMESGQTLHVLTGATNQGWSGAFSPDGELVAAGAGDQKVRIWRVDPGELLHTLGGFSFWVRSLSFSPDSRCLAAGATGGTLKVFNTQSGQCEQSWQIDLRKNSLAGNFLEIRNVQYTPRGDLFFSSTEGRSFGYRASNNLKWDSFEPDCYGLKSGNVAASADGSLFVAALGPVVGIWKIDSSA